MLQHEIIPEKLSGLDLTEGLNRVAGDSELYKKILLSFYLDNKKKPLQIQQALLANDFTTARHLAHSVKGVSGNISAKRLFTAASNLELQLNQESRQNLPELLDQFTAAMDEVINSLAFLDRINSLEVNSSPDDSPINWDSVARNIQELATLLDDFDMDAELSFRSLNNQLSQHQYQQTMHKLDNAMTNLEFDIATEILLDLADTLKIKLH
ncbi:Hpt domain-containing protein [Methyloprofundus sp.]|uniref:Hpt domain-containing protein n=1 Tax=Methyloprofundus sp. TaxID=2020875 RepID=UPI003D0B5F24